MTKYKLVGIGNAVVFGQVGAGPCVALRGGHGILSV